jgi:hypothetical protein
LSIRIGTALIGVSERSLLTGKLAMFAGGGVRIVTPGGNCGVGAISPLAAERPGGEADDYPEYISR